MSLKDKSLELLEWTKELVGMKVKVTLIGGLIVLVVGIFVGGLFVAGGFYLYQHWKAPAPTQTTPPKAAIVTPPTPPATPVAPAPATPSIWSSAPPTWAIWLTIIVCVAITILVLAIVFRAKGTAVGTTTSPPAGTAPTPTPAPAATAPTPRAPTTPTHVMGWLKVGLAIIGLIVVAALAFSFIRWMVRPVPVTTTPTQTATAFLPPGVKVVEENCDVNLEAKTYLIAVKNNNWEKIYCTTPGYRFDFTVLEEGKDAFKMKVYRRGASDLEYSFTPTHSDKVPADVALQRVSFMGIGDTKMVLLKIYPLPTN